MLTEFGSNAPVFHAGDRMEILSGRNCKFAWCYCSYSRDSDVGHLVGSGAEPAVQPLLRHAPVVHYPVRVLCVACWQRKHGEMYGQHLPLLR